MKRRKGFTLIEIMVVIAIIALLTGMVVFSVSKVRAKSRIAKAEADIASLETAAVMYQVDMGNYPGNDTLIADLTDPTGKPSGWRGPYVRIKEENIEGGALKDPWGNGYVYANPGVHNTSSFDIYSLGPDGTAGTGDDITNW